MHIFGRPRSKSSVYVPEGLPEIVKGAGEEQWEHRAALLAQGGQESTMDGKGRKRSPSVSPSAVSNVDSDVSVHRASDIVSHGRC